MADPAANKRLPRNSAQWKEGWSRHLRVFIRLGQDDLEFKASLNCILPKLGIWLSGRALA